MLLLTITALVLGLIFGVLMETVMPSIISDSICSYALRPIKSMFMSAIRIIIAPVVFFSLATCISQFKNLAELGRIAVKVMLVYTITTIVATTLGISMSLLLHPGEFGFAVGKDMGVEVVNEASEVEVSLVDMIVNIVPDNILKPIVESDTLQIMFLAILVGVAVGMIGEYSKPLMELFRSCNELFMKMTSLLTKFIPFAVLCSIWSMVLTAGAGLLLSLAGIICIVLLGLVLLICVDSMRLRMSGLSVMKFIRKYFPAMAHVFSTTSSGSVIA